MIRIYTRTRWFVIIMYNTIITNNVYVFIGPGYAAVAEIRGFALA